ncbi:MAG: RecX family transcriptional regulator [Chloroflexota bacterium]
MPKITALRAGRGRGKRINIFLDGKFAFSLGAEVVAKERLQAEQVLSDEQIRALVRSGDSQRCLDAALHYLGYRPRSESELDERLRRRGFADDVRVETITRLRRLGLVNDLAFAQFWKETRETFSPRSQRLTRLELRRKGVANDILEEVIDTIDDDESAYQAARNRSRHLAHVEYESFRRRLGEYLKRRGFSYGVINKAIRRVWQERNTAF